MVPELSAEALGLQPRTGEPEDDQADLCEGAHRSRGVTGITAPASVPRRQGREGIQGPEQDSAELDMPLPRGGSWASCSWP